MENTVRNCFCGGELPFEQCCQSIIDGKVIPKNAVSLMRSRFTAYVIKNYPYILQTYATDQRAKLTVKGLANSAKDTQWLSLQVLGHQAHEKFSQVEFKAYYEFGNSYCVMHELSDFILEAGKWHYTSGEMQQGSGKFIPERNSQCLCSSGKKFKKCCGR